MRFTKNEKGVKELWFEGYSYRRWIPAVQRKTEELEALWVCSRSPQGEHCKGHVTTDMECKNILSFKVHSHNPERFLSRRKASSISLPSTEAGFEFIANNKGGKKLIHDGYMYTKKYDMHDAIKWECSTRTLLKCKGTVTTDAACSKLVRCHIHNHPSNNHAIEAAKAKVELKKAAWLARDSTSLPRDIVKSTFSKISSEAQKQVGNAASNQRLVRRYRRNGIPTKVELEAEQMTLHKLAETVVARWEKFEAKWAKFEEKQGKELSRFKPY